MLAYSTGAMSADAPKPKGVKPGVTVVAVLNKAGTYCHLKFPADRVRSTLSSAKPEDFDQVRRDRLLRTMRP